MWGALIPLAAQLGGMWFGGRQAKKAQEQALARSPEEQAALRGAQGVAGTAADTAGSLIQQSRPYLQQPANYYQQLLSGNRAGMSQAVAAPMAQINEQYRGSARGVERSGLRGAARDQAFGELNRQRVGQLSGLTTGVQPAAAAGLAGLGSDLLRSATPLYGAAGNIYSSLLREGMLNRKLAYEEGEKSGAAWGDIFRTVGQSVYDLVNKNKKDPIPQQTMPPVTPGLPGGQLPGEQLPMPTPPVPPPPGMPTPTEGIPGNTLPGTPLPMPTPPRGPQLPPGQTPVPPGTTLPPGRSPIPPQIPGPQLPGPGGGGTFPGGGRRLRYFSQFGGPY